MGETMDHQMEVMEKMRKRLERYNGRPITLDKMFLEREPYILALL